MVDPDNVANRTIQTFTGEMFDVFSPDLDKIHMKDISHSLSMLCRYGGHAHAFYSVAEHSLLMSRYFADLGNFDLARVALLHDATEAYMGDLVRPLKLQMPTYREAELNLQDFIFDKFGLPPLTPPEIKDADLRICNDEREVLLYPRPWVIDHLEPLGVDLECWFPNQAEEEWINMFWLLFNE